MAAVVFQTFGNVLSRAKSRPKTRSLPAALRGETEGVAEGASPLQGFHGDTPIETSFGTLPARFLRRGDPVRTGRETFQPILAVHAYHFDCDHLGQNPAALPIVLEERTAYADLSKGSIVVAPGQRLLVKDLNAPTGGSVIEARETGQPRYAPSAHDETLTYIRLEFGEGVSINAGGYCLLVE